MCCNNFTNIFDAPPPVEKSITTDACKEKGTVKMPKVATSATTSSTKPTNASNAKKSVLPKIVQPMTIPKKDLTIRKRKPFLVLIAKTTWQSKANGRTMRKKNRNGLAVKLPNLNALGQGTVRDGSFFDEYYFKKSILSKHIFSFIIFTT
jgi:hypothetical protein